MVGRDVHRRDHAGIEELHTPLSEKEQVGLLVTATPFFHLDIHGGHGDILEIAPLVHHSRVPHLASEKSGKLHTPTPFPSSHEKN